MSDSIERVGIVGFGPMGQLVAEHMLPGKEVIAHDPNISAKQIGNVALTGIRDVALSDAVILAVPARSLEAATESVTRQDIADETLLVEIGSVKVFPSQVLKRFWGGFPTLMCHPLFGPQSAAAGLEGHSLIVTEEAGDRASELRRLWGRLGLTITDLTAEEHDQQMAEVHAKTFILGRLAATAGDTPTQFDPPSHKAVEMLEGLDAAHSPELFEAIVHFNPYVEPMIEKMFAKLQALRVPDPSVSAMINRNQMLAEHIQEMEARLARSN